MMFWLSQHWGNVLVFNPVKPQFTIVILIHYKQRIAVAIRLVVDEDDLEWGAIEKKRFIIQTIPQINLF